MVAFRFRLTEEEYYRYNYYTAWASPARRRYRALYFLRVILLYGAVALTYILSTSGHSLRTDITVFAVTGLAYLFLVPYFIRWSVKRKVKDVLLKKENHHILEESEIILTDDSIIDRDTVSESRYSWDAIVRFAETAESYYLYTNTYHAIVIPRRAIEDESQQRELDALLGRNLPLDVHA